MKGVISCGVRFWKLLGRLLLIAIIGIDYWSIMSSGTNKFAGHLHQMSHSFQQMGKAMSGCLISARGMGKSSWMAHQQEVMERQWKIDTGERLTKGEIVRDILVKLKMIDHIELDNLKTHFTDKYESFGASVSFGNIAIRVANHHWTKKKEFQRTVWYMYWFTPDGVECEVRASDKKVLSKTYPFNLDGFLELKRDFSDKFAFLSGHVIFRN